MTLPTIVAVALAPLDLNNKASLSRFHIAALAFQRAQQLKQGARPRVEGHGHKVVTVALLEVLANTISWSMLPVPLKA
jgi:DNA-directed RNA polymerase subunit K/omega